MLRKSSKYRTTHGASRRHHQIKSATTSSRCARSASGLPEITGCRRKWNWVRIVDDDGGCKCKWVLLRSRRSPSQRRHCRGISGDRRRTLRWASSRGSHGVPDHFGGALRFRIHREVRRLDPRVYPTVRKRCTFQQAIQFDALPCESTLRSDST
jgi:hypothetical protein